MKMQMLVQAAADTVDESDRANMKSLKTQHKHPHRSPSNRLRTLQNQLLPDPLMRFVGVGALIPKHRH